MYGYTSWILRINLSDNKIIKEELDTEIAKKYIGGRGFGLKILFNEIKPGIDPLGPENKLLFFTGPITGTPIPGNARIEIITKSPLTGIVGEGQAGGPFGPMLKYAGFDGIIIEGASDEPVYIFIKDSECEIKPANNLWGLRTSEVISKVKAEYGSEVTTMCIGPAGEKLVKYASIISEDGHVAARTGLGTVMGSKKLKAIIIHGKKKPIKIANYEKFQEIRKIFLQKINENWFANLIKKYGTNGGLHILKESGILPTKNYQSGIFNNADEIGGESKISKFKLKSTTCFACPIACKKSLQIGDKWFNAPEYESAASLGSICCIGNFEVLIKANAICNDYGVDTISTGMVIAFAMELFEKGIITSKDTGGMILKWGDEEVFLQILKNIVERQGFGRILSEGSKNAANLIGEKAFEYAIQVKGLELPMHEPRAKKDMALNYATAIIGASHSDLKGFENVKNGQDLASIIESLILCNFTVNSITVNNLTQLISAITGWNISEEELLRIGERITNLGRCFNIREGMTSNDDRLPRRFFEPIPEGPSKGLKLIDEEFKQMLRDYYKSRGWKDNGIPTKEKLKELELEFATEELKRLGIL